MLAPTLNQTRRTQLQPQLPYPTDALRSDLIRVRETWRQSRRRNDRYGIYKYLAVVFDLVMVWEKENHAVDRAKRALRAMGLESGDKIEPFAAVIRCTSARKKVDPKLRSKWVRVLMFAAETKAPYETLAHFIKRHGGMNLCAAGLTRLRRTQPPTQ